MKTRLNLKFMAVLLPLSILNPQIRAQLPNAWQISDDSTAGGSTLSYFTNLTAGQRIAATNDGFRFTVTSRLTRDFGSANPAMFFIYGDGTRRYGVGFDLNASGHLIAIALGSTTNTLTTDTGAATNYHTHQLVFDPSSQNVSYRFDDVPIATWAGQLSAGQSGMAQWGGSSSADRGEMNFHRLEFEIVGQGVIAAYDAGFAGNPPVAPSPASQAWTRSTASPTIPEGPVSPDVIPLPPLATTLAASEVAPATATLNASVNPGGTEAAYWFEYGATTGYGNFTATNTLPAGVSAMAVSNTLGGLSPLTTYHFRAVASNSAAVVFGQDQSFATPAALPNAWRITDDSTVGGSTLAYLTNLTQSQKIAATNSGWRYTVISRLTTDFGGIECMSFIFGDGARRYGVVWDRDAGGQLTGTMLGASNLTLIADSVAATNYHAHQLAYDPVAASVTYRLDGREILTWSGQATAAQSNVVQWGSSSSAGRAEMNFHRIQFEVIGQGIVASYNAGSAGNPPMAPDPTNQAWTRSLAMPTIGEGPVSPDTVPAPPLAITLPASDRQLSSATLNALLNPGGLATACHFEYGATTNYGSFTATNLLSAGFISAIVSNAVSGLSPATLYHFRAVASNSTGVVTGEDMSFSTLAYVTTLAATGVESTAATLNALVNPGGLDAAYYFDYGTSTNYGSFTATNAISGGVASATVSNAIGGLSPLTSYHFRAVVSNSTGVVTGQDLSFSTASFVLTLPATGVDTTTAILNALLYPDGLELAVYFEYGTTTNYGNVTATNLLSAGVFSATVSNAIGELFPLTTYHFRGVVSNSTGVVAGQDLSFSTPSVHTLNPGVHFSAAAWADYDRDGRLDFLLTGATTNQIPFNPVSQLWRNTGNGFANINAGLPAVFYGEVAWGDYDNDGRLDFLQGGFDPGPLTRLWRNTGAGFTNVNVGILGVGYGSMAWGDYDNDGRLDILVTGDAPFQLIAQVWRNTGSGFTNINAGLPGVFYSSGSWGDYDNDGRLDILLTGWDTTNRHTQLWRNTGSGFTNIQAALPQLYIGSTAWGDYDNDGRLDILLTGTADGHASGLIAQVWRNTGSGFTNIQAGLPGVGYSSVAWGDYDNDGRLDILLTGTTNLIASGAISQIWRNTGSGFTNFNVDLPAIYLGSVAWGEANSDNRLDILLTGNHVTQVQLNNQPASNTPPSAPTGLAAAIDFPHTLLSWNAATDSQTPSAGLSYNLRVGVTPGGEEIVSPAANSDGFRLLPALGNAQMRTNAMLNLPPGNYYWSVQAVDAGFAGGPFAPEASLVVSPVLNIAPLPGAVRLTWTTNSSGYLLETNSALTLPAGWGVLASNYSVIDTHYAVTNPIGDATRYYRLHKP